ncbi:MAG: magnesium transporter [Candidatus Nezhaarchaeota archaeon]|nr:magnesium transporter [Candidatus Nezhaarchaeota archaeon]
MSRPNQRDLELLYKRLRELIDQGRVEEAAEAFDSLDPPSAYAIVVRLGDDERYRLLTKSNLTSLLEVLDKLPDDVLYEILVVKGVGSLPKILSSLPIDEAADVLRRLPPRYRNKIIEAMPKELSDEVVKLLKYPPESVGSVMTPQVPVFNWNVKVGDAIASYVSRDKLGLYDRHHYIYVVDDGGGLVGWVDVKSFLTKPRDSLLKAYAQKPPVVVDVLEDREHAVRAALKYDLSEVPVVNENGKFLGVVTLDDVLDVLVTEYSEDLLKYGGFIETVRGSYIAAPPLRLTLKRIPMILYLYLMNAITGTIVASFADIIERVAILAAFLPMLADNSGNIGAQSSTIILRGLALGELRLSKSDILRVLFKEMLVSTFMLILLGPMAFAIAFGVVMFITASMSSALNVASIVLVALVISCYIADMVGAFLPIALAKLSVDPAVASAPLITTIGDIATVATYFWVAVSLLATVAA